MKCPRCQVDLMISDRQGTSRGRPGSFLPHAMREKRSDGGCWPTTQPSLPPRLTLVPEAESQPTSGSPSATSSPRWKTGQPHSEGRDPLN